MSLPRYLLMVALLGAAALFIQLRQGNEVIPPRLPVAAFPMQVGKWSGQDVYIEREVLRILGDGDFLVRLYRAPDTPPVDLFIAYFPTQRTGSTIHSPQNCLPGAGWAPVDFRRMRLEMPGAPPIVVNRYLIEKGTNRQLVLYWYQSNGRFVASEYWAKFYLVADSIRRNRSDGALVRVVTPVQREEDDTSAERRAVEFARLIIPLLDAHIPR